MEPRAERVVQLFAGEPPGALAGSGYLVAPDLVLTAAHVVDGGGVCRAVIGIPPAPVTEISVEDGSAICDADADVAVLRLAPDPPPCAACSAGRVGERPVPVDARAAGFPRFKLRREGGAPYRDVHVTTGTIQPLSNQRGGTLELTVAAAPDDDEPGHSPWEAMSGAAVWVRDVIVGVVAEHHPGEGASMLACRPLSAVRDPELQDALSLPPTPDQLADVGSRDPFDDTLDLVRRQWLARCPHDAFGTPRLEGREAELLSLADFCDGDGAMLGISAPPWAGKTALSAAFALDPPPGRTAVAVFVSQRTPGEAFLDACLKQLGAILRRPLDGVTGTDEKEAMLELMLEEAGARGRRIVLIVDGLDEDPRPPGAPAIAELLPRTLPAGMKLIVTSRPSAREVLAGHPLLEGEASELAASAAAGDVHRRARAELQELLQHPDPSTTDMVALLIGAEGLTVAELAELVEPGQPPGRIATTLERRSGRVFTALDTEDGRRYVFAHAELLAAAREFYGPAMLGSIAQRLDAWVARYARAGWPDDTPGFCLSRYLDVVRQRGDSSLLVAVIADPARRRLLATRTGNQLAAAEQIASAQQAIADAADQDVASATRLALHSFILRRHLAESADPQSLAFLVRTGRARTALDAVDTLSRDEFLWAERIARLAASLFEVSDDARAGSLMRTYDHRGLAARVAALTAERRPDVALRLIREAGTAPEPETLAALARDDAMLHVVVELAGADLERRLAVALAVAARDPGRALELCEARCGFLGWSAGTKWVRTASFARVEVARHMTDDERALDVLVGELERGLDPVLAAARDHDVSGALMAVALRDPGRAAALVETHTDSYHALRTIARVAIAAATGADDVDVQPDRQAWLSRDVDLIARFGRDLAAAPASFVRLLRGTLDVPRGFLPKLERPEEAVTAILTELAALDAFDDGDLEAYKEHLQVAHPDDGQTFSVMARRVAASDPARAAELAYQAGPMATWVLRDVVLTAAERDPLAALAVVDTVEVKYTATRNILLGALGSVVDPGDAALIAELTRRFPQPDEGEAAVAAFAECGLRLAGLLAPDDPRAERLYTRFEPHASGPAHDRFHLDQALVVAAEAPDVAVEHLRSVSAENHSAARALGEAARRVAPLLPPETAVQVLAECADERLGAAAMEDVLTAMAAIDPGQTLVVGAKQDARPEVLLRALAGAPAARVAATALMILPELADMAALELSWAVERLAPGSRVADAAGRSDIAMLLDEIDRGDVATVGAAYFATELEVRERDVGFLAATTGFEAARAWIEHIAGAAKPNFAPHDDGLDIARIVDFHARTDPAAALAIIEPIDWEALSARELTDMLYGLAKERALAWLARRDWEPALVRAQTIVHGPSVRDALGEVAGCIPASWPPAERASALRGIFAIAAERQLDTEDLVESVLRALRSHAAVDRSIAIEVLADSVRWPTNSGLWIFGEAIGVAASAPETLDDVVAGFIAAAVDLRIVEGG